jgi:selenocysteine lyase/cysteine desulfurase
MALAERGVQVRLINVRELGVIRPIDVMGQVDEQTRLVALASCHFISGARLDVPAIGKFLRERNILFCVDAIQTLGAFPTTVETTDFLAADSHKWLLGPCAAGLMYVRHDLQGKLRPPVFGWHNVRCPNYVAQEEIVYRRDAHRFEAGTHNLLGIVGMNAAMELILELGVENIAAELLRKRAWLVPALEAKGYQVVGSNAGPGAASGIVSFQRGEGADLPGLHKKLEGAGIFTSLRVDRQGRRYLRRSPHGYNTDAALHRVRELL